MKDTRIKEVLKWIGGWLFSCLFIWCVGYFFVDSGATRRVDAMIGDYVRTSGLVIKWRSEGWGNTHVGKHGFIKGEDQLALSPVPKFILWGDSHVEALQVSDDEKITPQYNRMAGGSPYSGISCGKGGRSVADYYFLLAKYEKAFPNIKGHVLLLGGLADVSPNRTSGNKSRFLCDPWRLEQGSDAPNATGLKYGPILKSLRAEVFYNTYRDLKKYELQLLPGRGDEALAESPRKHDSCDIEEGWKYLLRRLKNQTEGFLVFLYCPVNVPVMEGGLILRNNPESALLELFKRLCREEGIGFVDMGPPFDELYEKERAFPRGFFNMPPSKGHFNARGQRLIAQALYEYFQESKI